MCFPVPRYEHEFKASKAYLTNETVRMTRHDEFKDAVLLSGGHHCVQ